VTYFAIALVALVALLALMLYRQQLSHMVAVRVSAREWRDERERILEAAHAERASLLDRIQHPEYVQPAAVAYADADPPTDALELQYVGEEVPSFVHVGDQNLPPEILEELKRIEAEAHGG